MEIRPGMAVEVRTAYDKWHKAHTVTGVEGTYRDGKKIHDFPVIWVVIDESGSNEPLPWPAEDVRQLTESILSTGIALSVTPSDH